MTKHIPNDWVAKCKTKVLPSHPHKVMTGPLVQFVIHNKRHNMVKCLAEEAPRDPCPGHKVLYINLYRKAELRSGPQGFISYVHELPPDLGAQSQADHDQTHTECRGNHLQQRRISYMVQAGSTILCFTVTSTI